MSSVGDQHAREKAWQVINTGKYPLEGEGMMDFPLIPNPGGLMRCPVCGDNTPDAWKVIGGIERMTEGVRGTKDDPHVYVDWMRCAGECRQAVVRLHEQWHEFRSGLPLPETVTWTVRPRGEPA